MSHTFDSKLVGGVPSRLAKTKRLAAINGVDFMGDSRKGTFYGRIPHGVIGGCYSIEGRKITVTVTTMPNHANIKAIESRLRSFIEIPNLYNFF